MRNLDIYRFSQTSIDVDLMIACHTEETKLSSLKDRSTRLIDLLQCGHVQHKERVWLDVLNDFIQSFEEICFFSQILPHLYTSSKIQTHGEFEQERRFHEL